MRYISLFSGIGGFEYAIHKVMKNASCVGFAEIDSHAIKEYERHFPDHINLGNVTNIKKKDIDNLGKIDLLVAGFPCNNLSSANSTSRNGLDGDKSGLFWVMIKILKWIRHNNPELKIIIENNASMSNKWRDTITSELSKALKKRVFCNYFDSSQWVVQRRRRYYWTLNEIPAYKGKRKQSVLDILSPIEISKKYEISDTHVKNLNLKYGNTKKGIILDRPNRKFVNVDYSTRWASLLSKTSNDYIKCIITTPGNNMLFDSRNGMFLIREYTKEELNKLFGYPNNYVKTEKKTHYFRLYGMSVVPPVIMHILKHI